MKCYFEESCEHDTLKEEKKTYFPSKIQTSKNRSSLTLTRSDALCCAVPGSVTDVTTERVKTNQFSRNSESALCAPSVKLFTAAAAAAAAVSLPLIEHPSGGLLHHDEGLYEVVGYFCRSFCIF
ncbi:hypothetical protein T07_7825 [Trichinella nelsoni]|uniref:Uncharacterized protein n=1 Tax=Trichinella nelsoni TaxID=6336 RepID=A0A0V0RXU2_9BILA|nr:hypothetical protein T07_7825 [Trichinella nelsoni]